MTERLKAAVMVIGLIAVAAPAWGQQRLDSHLRSPPAYRATAIPVSVGLYVNNLVGLDESKETWEMSGELSERWIDPRLRFNGKPGEHRTLRAAEIWVPELQIENAITPRSKGEADLSVQPDGSVLYTEEFSVKASTALDMRRFPFDSQRLPLIVQTSLVQSSEVRLITDWRMTGVNYEDFATLAQWQLLHMDADAGRSRSALEQVARPRITFALQVRRNYQSFFWKFMVPLLVMVLLSWLAFWMPADEYKTGEQLGISLTTLLTIVAFTLSMTSFLPRTAYFTFIDGFLWCAYIWVVGAIVNIYVQTHLRNRGKQETALKLRRISAWALPISFYVAQFSLFLAFQRITG